jgi:hypothetical protein
MNYEKQQALRDLAESLLQQQAAHVDATMLAQGTLDLLDYTEELVDALSATTEACCNAVSRAYDQRSSGFQIIAEPSQLCSHDASTRCAA